MEVDLQPVPARPRPGPNEEIVFID
jgi:hypothetical protein